MTRFLVLVCILLIGNTIQAFAQAKRIVRAGDQSTYARLIVPVSDEEVWELRTSGRRVVFAIDGGDEAFEVGQVRDRISRTRLLSIRDTGRSGFEMSLGCDCTVVANIDSGSVVIDVVDPGTEPPTLSMSRRENGSVEEDLSPEQQQSAEALVSIEPSEVMSAPDLPFVERPKPATSRPQRPLSDVALSPSNDEPPQSEVVQQLIRQLEAAAEQGIVEMAPEDASKSDSLPTATKIEEKVASLEPNEQSLDGLDALTTRVEDGLKELNNLPDSVRITVPGAAAVPEIQNSEDGLKTPSKKEIAHCIPREYLDFAAWTRNAPFSDQIQDLRTVLYDDVDNVDPTVLRDLIRIYVLLGFGVEAQALLADEAVEFGGRAILEELAIIAEGDDLQPNSALAKAIRCDGRNALWRTIAVDKQEQLPVENVDDLLVEFSNLPVKVRRHYGPRLIRSFLYRKQLDAATAVFAIIDRAVGPHGDAHELIRARLFEIEGNTNAAEAILVDLFTANGELAPEALLRLAELYTEEGREIPADMIADLEAEAYRYRSDPIGTSLRLAEIRAKAGSMQLGAALDVIASELGQNPEADGDYLAAADTVLLEADWKDVGTVPYTTVIFKHQDIVTHPEISAATQLYIGEQLLELGLPSPAISFASKALAENNPRAVLMVASAFLDVDDPESALSVLEENNPLHSPLRAAALEALGQFDDALAAKRFAGTDTDTLAAWRAGDWRAVDPKEDEDLSNLATFMAERMPVERASENQMLATASGLQIASEPRGEVDTAPELSLAEANKMTAEAASARSAISNLLDRY